MRRLPREKGALVEAISEDGFAVLNADDPLVMGMARRTGARVVTFGHSETADCRILEVDGGFPDGITVRLSWKNQEFDVPTQFIAHHFSQAVAAAATVGLELGVPVEDICKAIGQTEVIPLRLSPHKVPGGPLILADCRKAPQGTLHLAFDALRVVDAPRHRIVLGNISDYAGSSGATYRKAVADGLDVAEELILITKSRSCTVAAQKADTEGRLRIFGTTREAAEYVARTAIEGEAILLKGSGNLHMERILLNLTSGVKCWENVCRIGETCFACGLYAHEFEDHARIRRRRGWARFWRGPKTTPATQSPSAQ
ncbi:MAG: Mur ligase family protein [Roseovarius sp.]|nr:Mur ligase family protein [Roseovarius sp.]